MRASILKIGFVSIVIFLVGSVYADTNVNVFTEALINGKAHSSLPEQPELQAIERYLQEQTHSTAPLIIEARLVKRFQQQPQCGRVAFLIVQPGSQSAWPELGGQLNICEDGTPPLQVCANKPDVLILSSEKCSDNTAPQNTLEVKEAIRVALDEGGLTQEQVKNSLHQKGSHP
jgi:hypothetical protein